MAAKRKRVSPHKQLVNSARKYYDAMLEAQGNVCAICGRQPYPQRRFCIDHDHRKMYIRGILCNRCNKWLWTFVDEGILEAAWKYVARGPEWFEEIKRKENN